MIGQFISEENINWIGYDMRAGQLKKSVKIQTPVLAEDSYSAGSDITSWNDTYRNVRAGVYPIKSNERIENLKLEGEISHRIKIRYLENITPKKVPKFLPEQIQPIANFLFKELMSILFRSIENSLARSVSSSGVNRDCR